MLNAFRPLAIAILLTVPSFATAQEGASEILPGLEAPHAAPQEQGAQSLPAPRASGGAITVPDSVPVTITKWPTGKKMIAITYDDGPHPTITPTLIKLLKQKRAKATFFLLGQQVKAYPKVAAQLNDPDFEIANHSYTHPQLTKLSAAGVKSELSKTEGLIEEIFGTRSTLMRPPYGAANDGVKKICANEGYRVILWDVDTNDWRKRPASVMTKFVTDNAGDGSIILFHDRYQASVDSSEQIIDHFQARGYQFVTVSELLSQPRVLARPAPATPAANSSPKR